jgi:hypothetical protein
MRVMVFAPAVAVTLIGFVIAWQFVNPAPPRTVVIATGQPDGAYFQFAQRYAELLAAEGVTDLRGNIPPHDTALLAASANLVATPNFHPALVSLLLQIARRVHGAGSLLENPGAFPNTRNLDFPLDAEAKRYFQHGPPFLQRYLSFWSANLIDRLKVMLVPLVTLLIPLFKIMPPTYRWRVRKKIYRWSRQLQSLDIDHPEQQPQQRLRELRARLAGIEEEFRKVRLPLSYVDELYDLRLHIGLVRSKLRGEDTVH